jgi:hypothetical protein
MKDQEKVKARELAERLKKWYKGGRKGMITLCETEGASESVKKAVHHWYDMGAKRLDCIIEELEKLGEEPQK